MADDTLRQDLVDQVREEQQKRKPAARVHRGPSPVAQPVGSGDAQAPAVQTYQGPSHAPSPGLPAVDEGGDSTAPRKRRRRRRSGAARGDGSPEGGADSGA